MPEPVNLWTSPEHALEYLSRADSIPHRTEGEAELLSVLPRPLRRVLDLGTGDGRLLNLVKLARPEVQSVAVDFSPTMLAKARERFVDDKSVAIVAHDLSRPLPALGTFDAVVSSFAIHHLDDDRKHSLYSEIFQLLNAGGVFCNLEHVSSPTPLLHSEFLALLGATTGQDDPSNKLLDTETQLKWLQNLGFHHVDCLWKWRELALLTARRH